MFHLSKTELGFLDTALLLPYAFMQVFTSLVFWAHCWPFWFLVVVVVVFVGGGGEDGVI